MSDAGVTILLMRTTVMVLFLNLSVAAALAAAPKAAQLLAEADKLYEQGRFEEALTAYEAAERADPALDGQKWLSRLTGFRLRIEDASASLRDDLKAQEALDRRIAHAYARNARRHPDTTYVRDAASALAAAGEHETAAALADEVVKTRPRNIHGHLARGIAAAGLAIARPAEATVAVERFLGAVDDALRTAVTADDHYTTGALTYEFVSQSKVAADSTLQAIERGLVAFAGALKRQPDHGESMIYSGLLLRQKAKLLTNAEEAARLEAEADVLRTRGMETMKKRSRQ